MNDPITITDFAIGVIVLGGLLVWFIHTHSDPYLTRKQKK